MTETILKAACIQLNSGPDIAGNIESSAALIRAAAEQGAQLVVTPENSCHMRFPQSEKRKSALPEQSHTMLAAYADLARALGIWLLAGSVSIKLDGDDVSIKLDGDDERLANRSVLFDNRGQVAARYDKIHLFDVDLPTGESHRESDLMRPGTQAVAAQTPWGKIGMSICYDLRFAHLYRALAKAGAAILTVPSAFTVPTGRAHWETLLRARAIETGCFVLAPAQCGTHDGGRQTYGHSLIIGPWGDILAEAGEEPGLITANLDLSAVTAARTAIPALRHDRDFSGPDG